MIELIVAIIVALAGGYFIGGRNAKSKLEAKQQKASRDADIKRDKLDEDIEQDTDLVSRAKRAGVLRDRDPE